MSYSSQCKISIVTGKGLERSWKNYPFHFTFLFNSFPFRPSDNSIHTQWDKGIHVWTTPARLVQSVEFNFLARPAILWSWVWFPNWAISRFFWKAATAALLPWDPGAATVTRFCLISKRHYTHLECAYVCMSVCMHIRVYLWYCGSDPSWQAWGSIIELKLPPDETPGLMRLHPYNTNVLQSITYAKSPYPPDIFNTGPKTWCVWNKYGLSFQTA